MIENKTIKDILYLLENELVGCLNQKNYMRFVTIHIFDYVIPDIPFSTSMKRTIGKNRYYITKYPVYFPTFIDDTINITMLVSNESIGFGKNTAIYSQLDDIIKRYSDILKKQFKIKCCLNINRATHQKQNTKPVISMTPYERIFIDAFGLKTTDPLIIPENAEKTIKKFVSGIKGEKWGIEKIDVIHKRYFDNMSVADIADYYHKNEITIRHIIASILYELYSIDEKGKIQFGEELVKEKIKLKQVQFDKRVSDYVKEIQRQTDKVIAENDVEAIQKCIDKCYDYLRKNTNVKVYDNLYIAKHTNTAIPLEELGIQQKVCNKSL